jgi:hypothetical protein
LHGGAAVRVLSADEVKAGIIARKQAIAESAALDLTTSAGQLILSARTMQDFDDMARYLGLSVDYVWAAHKRLFRRRYGVEI